jgi:hypothetical protein
MGVRVFSCGNNLVNLNICIKDKVIGFRRMHNDILQGDMVYIVIKKDKVSHCCARAIIANTTDYVPWENPELYVLCYRIENIEFCNPFSLDFLKNTSAGDAWGAIFIRGSLSIKDKDALTMLSENFNKNISSKFYSFKDIEINPPKGKRGRKKKEYDNNEEDEQNLTEESPVEDDEDSDDSIVDIMSTFKVVKFQNETDKNYGLENLVNNNFYKLFHHIQEQNSILIPHDRMFRTKGKDGVNGIVGIPDAVLVSFDKNDKKSCIKINIIEYECYGKEKSTSTKKFDYLNSHIIPQLIKFASTFSIVTDSQIREDTIDSWLDKIVNYCDQDILEKRIFEWLKQISSQTRESQIFDKFRKELRKAFKNNIRIMLIIDELTGEQRETIKNIINSFKLKENTKNSACQIDFSGYVVRLEYMLNYDDTATSKYALSIQDN